MTVAKLTEQMQHARFHALIVEDASMLSEYEELMRQFCESITLVNALDLHVANAPKRESWFDRIKLWCQR